MSPPCLALVLCPFFRSLPLPPLGIRRKRELYFPLCLLVAILYAPFCGCCHLTSPLLTLSFHSCFHLSASIPLSQRAGSSRKQTGRQTERDGDHLGFSYTILFLSSIKSPSFSRSCPCLIPLSCYSSLFCLLSPLFSLVSWAHTFSSSCFHSVLFILTPFPRTSLTQYPSFSMHFYCINPFVFSLSSDKSNKETG